jgi:hypothetical protein
LPTSGTANYADGISAGNGGMVNIDQSGSGNQSYTYQLYGSGNQATIKQTDGVNVAYVTQGGNANQAFVDQSGASQTASITQFGNTNMATVTQH